MYRIIEDGAKQEHFPELSDEHTFKEIFNHFAHESRHSGAGHNHTHHESRPNQIVSKSRVIILPSHHFQHQSRIAGAKRGKKKHS